MEWLNYHHLYYFWIVAREGTIAAAGQELGLAPSTISEQIHQLERSLNQKIFKRSGRRLVLTDVGQVVFRFADEIFTLGRELSDFVQGRPTGRPMRLNVGIADVVPKLVACKLLEPALAIPEKIHLVCREDRPERLLADLALHQLDVVITDAPVGPDARIRAFNHLLGECGVSFYAAPELAARLRDDFPNSLHGAPFLLPTSEAVLRRMLDQWFDTREIKPSVVAEFEDSALLKVFGQTGMGVFAGPSVVADEICKQHSVELVGQADGLRERFYAVSVERKLKHPAVVAISESARDATFSAVR